MFNSIVIHFDELTLKGANRAFFERRLENNLREALGVKIFREAAKFVIKLGKNEDFSLLRDRLKLIPGISNFFPAFECAADIDAIKTAALAVVKFYSPKTFKIEATRSCKKFPMNSMEIMREVGGYVLTESDDELRVDVRKPELLVRVEVQGKKAFVLGAKETGIGGLPVGTARKIVCLLSGGIDSPVAGAMMMKRGAEVIFVHCFNSTINQAGVEKKIQDLVAALAKIQGSAVLYIVPFDELQREVIANVAADLRMIVYRRLMFKVAEAIAKKEDARAIVTGDSLGQVASQTLENLDVVYEATDLLKFAPLIGMNKREVMDLAQKIGTYEISIRPYGDCCSFMIAKHPETRANIKVVKSQEKNIGAARLLKKAVKNGEKKIVSL